MAKQKVFAPFDSKLKVWMNPMFFPHTGQAERVWLDICNQPEAMPSKHPSDFVLYQIGEFDDDTGRLESLQVPVQVLSALEAKSKPEGELPLRPLK